jgi:hypothetical protein
MSIFREKIIKKRHVVKQLPFRIFVAQKKKFPAILVENDTSFRSRGPVCTTLQQTVEIRNSIARYRIIHFPGEADKIS